MKTIFSSQPFQDEAGAALANGSLILTLPGGVYEIINGGGQVAGRSLIVNLDATGKLPNTQILASDELTGTPAYTVQVCAQANGLQVIASTTWSIIGASPIDVSFMVPATGGVSQPMPTGQQLLPFSATPVFNAASFSGFSMTLTGNVTGPTTSGGQAGLIYTWKIIEDNVGGHTFSWPANVINPTTINTAPNAVNLQSFYFDGANFYAVGPLESVP